MENLYKKLKSDGIKITIPRKLIIEILTIKKEPLSIAEIHSFCENVDFTSVYRTINLLFKLGFIRKLSFGNREVKYELIDSTDEHEHFVVCVKCGKKAQMNVCFVHQVEKMTNFLITEHLTEFKGVCPECLKN